jgi:hypothetical protein
MFDPGILMFTCDLEYLSVEHRLFQGTSGLSNIFFTSYELQIKDLWRKP